MNETPSRLRFLLAELKRRRVYRVAVVYAAVAFVIWQAAEIVFPALGFPKWTLAFVIVVVLLGFRVALVLAWALEITLEGVRRTEPDAQRLPGYVGWESQVTRWDCRYIGSIVSIFWLWGVRRCVPT